MCCAFLCRKIYLKKWPLTYNRSFYDLPPFLARWLFWSRSRSGFKIDGWRTRRIRSGNRRRRAAIIPAIKTMATGRHSRITIPTTWTWAWVWPHTTAPRYISDPWRRTASVALPAFPRSDLLLRMTEWSEDEWWLERGILKDSTTKRRMMWMICCRWWGGYCNTGVILIETIGKTWKTCSQGSNKHSRRGSLANVKEVEREREERAKLRERKDNAEEENFSNEFCLLKFYLIDKMWFNYRKNRGSRPHPSQADR